MQGDQISSCSSCMQNAHSMYQKATVTVKTLPFNKYNREEVIGNISNFYRPLQCFLRAVERVTLLRFLFGMHPYQPTLEFAFVILE